MKGCEEGSFSPVHSVPGPGPPSESAYPPSLQDPAPSSIPPACDLQGRWPCWPLAGFDQCFLMPQWGPGSPLVSSWDGEIHQSHQASPRAVDFTQVTAVTSAFIPLQRCPGLFPSGPRNRPESPYQPRAVFLREIILLFPTPPKLWSFFLVSFASLSLSILMIKALFY